MQNGTFQALASPFCHAKSGPDVASANRLLWCLVRRSSYVARRASPEQLSTGSAGAVPHVDVRFKELNGSGAAGGDGRARPPSKDRPAGAFTF